MLSLCSAIMNGATPGRRFNPPVKASSFKTPVRKHGKVHVQPQAPKQKRPFSNTQRSGQSYANTFATPVDLSQSSGKEKEGVLSFTQMSCGSEANMVDAQDLIRNHHLGMEGSYVYAPSNRRESIIESSPNTATKGSAKIPMVNSVVCERVQKRGEIQQNIYGQSDPVDCRSETDMVYNFELSPTSQRMYVMKKAKLQKKVNI